MADGLLLWLRSTIERDLMRAMALPRGPWHVELLGDKGYPQRISNARAVLIAEVFEGGDGTPIADHVAAHDSRDTISRCEAELALLDEAEKAIAEAKDMGYWSVAEGEVHGAASAWRGMLETLAAGYKHRPGYGSWVPSAATPGRED